MYSSMKKKITPIFTVILRPKIVSSGSDSILTTEKMFELNSHIVLFKGDPVKPRNTIWECSKCDEKFKWQSLLNVHIDKVHEGNQKYKCSQCDYKSAIKACWQKHVEGKKQFKI